MSLLGNEAWGEKQKEKAGGLGRESRIFLHHSFSTAFVYLAWFVVGELLETVFGTGWDSSKPKGWCYCQFKPWLFVSSFFFFLFSPPFFFFEERKRKGKKGICNENQSTGLMMALQASAGWKDTLPLPSGLQLCCCCSWYITLEWISKQVKLFKTHQLCNTSY